MASQLKEFDVEKLTGRIYTPEDVVALILDEVGFGGDASRFGLLVDPACGDGAFLISAALRILNSNVTPEEKRLYLSELHGWDIDAEAVEKCRHRLEELAQSFGINGIDWQVRLADALSLDHAVENSGRFDFVVANPPYVRIQHLDVETRAFLVDNYSYCGSGSTDIFFAFIELGERLLSRKGKAGYITPNSFLNSEAGKPLRKAWALNKKPIKLMNFGHYQVFTNASTYNAIFTFSNDRQDSLTYENWSYPLKHLNSKKVSFEELATRGIWNLDVEAPLDGGIKLRDICSIHVGIQTLADKVYFVTPLEDHGETISIKSRIDNEIYQIEKGALRRAVKASKLASTSLDFLMKERVIWPYGDLGTSGSQAMEEIEFLEKFPLTLNYLKAHKKTLDARDNGALNPAGWYAFARQQGIRTQFQEKIVFPPMVETPRFFLIPDTDVVIYSGYFILSKYDLGNVLEVLESDELEQWVRATGRDFRGGWKSMSKKLLDDFPVPQRFESQFQSNKLF